VYPDRHGIMQGDIKFSEESAQPLGVLLGNDGYESVAISQSFIVGPKFGMETGFDQFFFNSQLNGPLLRSQEVRSYLLHWLTHRSNTDRPFFAYIHTVGPHAPYTPVGRFRQFAEEAPGSLKPKSYIPSEFVLRNFGDDPEEVDHLRALYDGEVLYADEEFGRFIALLKHLDLYDKSLIIVTSDHGEEFGEHGGFDHGRTVYGEVLNVPLTVKYPGQRWAGTRIDRRVSTVDVAETIRELLGRSWAGVTLDGTSLLPDRLTAEAPRSVALYSEVNPLANEFAASVDYRTLMANEIKCIESLNGIDQFRNKIPRLRAFDLNRGPLEVSPIEGSDREALLCRQALQEWENAREALRAGEPGSTQWTEDEAMEGLRALAYIE